MAKGDRKYYAYWTEVSDALHTGKFTVLAKNVEEAKIKARKQLKKRGYNMASVTVTPASK